MHTSDENLTRNTDVNGKYMYVVYYYDATLSLNGSVLAGVCMVRLKSAWL